MSELALLDNDIVLKACCFNADDKLVAVLHHVGFVPEMLAAARFVIAGRIAKSRSIADRVVASGAFERALQVIGLVEPSEEELKLAAALEVAAQAENLEMDSGESQLVAILMTRGLRLLVTGDKRAVVAIEALVGARFAVAPIACLEQVVAELLERFDASLLRNAVCREPKVDTALSICFACRSVVAEIGTIRAGLRSYINALRQAAPLSLLASDDLSALVP